MGSSLFSRTLPGLLLLLSFQGTGHAKLLPLSPEQRRLAEAPPDERPYDVRLHFLQSNERRHDVFFPTLRGRGGGYVGVGSDQNYTLAAIAGADLVWLLDIDAWVVQWHKIYAALVPTAETPEALCSYFTGKRDVEVQAALSARWGPAEGAALFKDFRRDRWRLQAYLQRERTLKENGQPVTWLSDPALYGRVRELMEARRVVARVGDLHGEHTVLGVAAAAKAEGSTIRTLYLSNAEQWFRYSPQFRRNMAAIPRDQRSVVLRTLARHELAAPAGDRWHFSVQSLDEFVRRLEEEPLKPRPKLLMVQDLIPEMARTQRAPGALRGLSLLGVPQPITAALSGTR